jgi:cytochrome c oxidase assembly factor CtaG
MISTPPAMDLLTDWRLDPGAALAVAVLGVSWEALRRRHPHWPVGRTVAGVGALLVAVVATQSGLATHDTSSFTAHALQHVLLGMVVPVLAALAAPVTLVLQAADATTRAVVRRALRSRLASLVGRPAFGFAAFGGSVVVLTFSPLLDLAAEDDAVHLALHVHLVLAGSVFAWPLVGADPLPHRPGHGARLLIVLAAVPFHAFVGVALLGADQPLFDAYPSLEDQRRAAGVLWGSGEVLTLAVAGIVFAGWYRAEQRAGARADRRGDAADHP